MTESKRGHCRLVIGAWIAAGLFAACDSGSLDSAPRVGTVPPQRLTNSAFLSLNLASYVTDKEGDELVYEVVEGGGSFSGSIYSQTFETMGSYSVRVRVTDISGRSGEGSFDVTVTSANFAVVNEADDLHLYDIATHRFLPVATAGGSVETVKATLADGRLVYERLVGLQTDLFLYNPFLRSTTTLGNDTAKSEAYSGKTSTGQIVFTTATSTDTDLWIWSAANGLRPISGVVGEHDSNAMINTADLVFYQRGSGGQSDIYVYDPVANVSTAVSTATTAETLHATLPDGAAVFTRLGTGGESDLFWYRQNSGLIEVGADQEGTIGTLAKTYKSHTSDGKVIFEVTGAEIDLYVWNPSNGSTRLISGSDTGNATWQATTASNGIVYHVAHPTNGSDVKLHLYTPNLTRVIAATAGADLYRGSLSNGNVVVEITAAGKDLHHYDVTLDALQTIASASASDYLFQKVLVNDRVVYKLTGGALSLYNAATLSSQTISADATSTFAGEAAGGDFAFNLTAAAQTDLYLWDESAGGVVTISTDAGNDTFCSVVANSEVLFSRAVAPRTTTDLFRWEPNTGEISRLTDSTGNHSVVSTYSATYND